jgi:hypothetical protein
VDRGVLEEHAVLGRGRPLAQVQEQRALRAEQLHGRGWEPREALQRARDADEPRAHERAGQHGHVGSGLDHLALQDRAHVQGASPRAPDVGSELLQRLGLGPPQGAARLGARVEARVGRYDGPPVGALPQQPEHRGLVDERAQLGEVEPVPVAQQLHLLRRAALEEVHRPEEQHHGLVGRQGLLDRLRGVGEARPSQQVDLEPERRRRGRLWSGHALRQRDRPGQLELPRLGHEQLALLRGELRLLVEQLPGPDGVEPSRDALDVAREGTGGENGAVPVEQEGPVPGGHEMAWHQPCTCPWP